MADASEKTEEKRTGNSHSHTMTHESRLPDWGGPQEEASVENEGEGGYSFADFVDRHPVKALVAGFGLGVGLGVLAVAIFKREEKHSWSSRFSTPSFQELSSGIRKLPEKVADYIPESLSWR